MTRCENCGIDFEMPKEPTEVTSSKILCPACTAERRERIKAQKAAAARAAAAAPATAAVPAVQPAAVKPAATRPVAPSVPRVAAAASAPAPRPVARPQPSHDDGGGEEHHIDYGAARRQREEQAKRTMLIGWMAAGALLLVGGSVVMVVMSKHNEEKRVIEQRQEEVSAFFAKLKLCDLNTLDGARQAVKLVIENKKVWQEESIAAEVMAINSRALIAVREKEVQQKIIDNFDLIKKTMAGNPDLSTLTNLNAKVKELESDAGTAGPEFQAQYNALRLQVGKAYVQGLRQAATTSAAGGSKSIAVLTQFGLAEDEATAQFRASLGDTEATKYWQEIASTIIRESDELANNLFTPDYINKIPWKDLLSATEQPLWVRNEMPTLTCKFENGALVMINEGEGAKTGGFTYGQGEWHDMIVDMEYKLDTGQTTCYYRLGDKADSKLVPAIVIKPGTGEVKTPYGTVQTLLTSVIASKMTATLGNEAAPVIDVELVRKNRRGRFFVSVGAGSKLTITRLRVRVLR